MDPGRIHAYLQVACAGLGFDVGEVWWTSNENGSSTVAAFADPASSDESSDDESTALVPGRNSVLKSGKRRLRFVQLYTSQSYESRRSELLNPPDQAENIQQHVLSPRLVDSIAKTAQVVWATTKKQEGLTGRSDIRLRTAVGMPVAVDEHGNMCVVVMFSPNNIQSTDDALEYLQSISHSATSSSIPCLMPVFDPSRSRLRQLPPSNSYQRGLVPHPDPSELGEGVVARFVSLEESQSFRRDSSSPVSDEPEVHTEHTLSSAPKDTFGIPMLPSFAELGNNINSQGEDTDAFDEVTHGIWTTIMESVNDVAENMGETDGLFDMSANQAAENIGVSDPSLIVDFTTPPPMKVSRKVRLAEFCSAFLGMSVFDLADVWVPAGAMYPESLRHVMTVSSMGANQVMDDFRQAAEKVLVKNWMGAVGTASATGNPVWSVNQHIFADGGRLTAFQKASFHTMLAIPVFSSKSDKASCVVAFYSFVRSDSVPFVLKFVQQALRLLWEGMDNVEPHESVSSNMWQNVAPADLGEMAADVEMHQHFLQKKRPHTQISEPTQDVSEEQPVATSWQGIQSVSMFNGTQPIQMLNGKGINMSFSTPNGSNGSQHLKVEEVHDHINDAIRSIQSATPFETHVNTNASGSKRAHVMSTVGRPLMRPAPLAMPKPLPSRIVNGKTSPKPTSAPQFQAPAFMVGIQNPTPVNMMPVVSVQPTPVTSLDTSFCMPIMPTSEPVITEGKLCRIQGCGSLAAARRPYCAKHSGNRQCEHSGCNKCAQGSTRFCIAHGGGRRCTFPGCDKGARDKFFCAAHGGGKRCKHEGCSKSAVGGSNLCTAHGGGRRCSVPGCDKSAQSSTKFCVKHGGGKKCSFEGCQKVARGRTLFCAAHGGGVRCKLDGCNRVAIGKLQLCRAHGGGARTRKGAGSPTGSVGGDAIAYLGNGAGVAGFPDPAALV